MQRIETLQSNFGGELQGYCYMYLSDFDLACDAAQEVFCKALMQESEVNSERAWLYRCARNHCLNTIRQHSRQTKALNGRSQIRPVEQHRLSVLSGIVRKEIHERLSEIVHNLPLDLRVPLFLRYFAAFTRIEIVQHLNLPEHTVKARLHRALKELRKHSSLRLT